MPLYQNNVISREDKRVEKSSRRQVIISLAVLSHHRTSRSAYGGSLNFPLKICGTHFFVPYISEVVNGKRFL